MFGRDTCTPKPETLREPRHLRAIPIDEVLTSTKTPEPGTQEPCHKSYFWWTNPENIITLEDITALY